MPTLPWLLRNFLLAFCFLASLSQPSWLGGNAPPLTLNTGVYPSVLVSVFILTYMRVAGWSRTGVPVGSLGVGGLGWMGFSAKGAKHDEQDWTDEPSRKQMLAHNVNRLLCSTFFCQHFNPSTNFALFIPLFPLLFTFSVLYSQFLFL